jgi:hypothetical protein
VEKPVKEFYFLLTQWVSRKNYRTSNIHFALEFVRNADLRAPSQA